MAWVPPCLSKSRKSNLGVGEGFIDEVRLEFRSEFKEAEFGTERVASVSTLAGLRQRVRAEWLLGCRERLAESVGSESEGGE